MKKAISILAIMIVAVSAMSVTAFAHGGHGTGNRARQQPRYELCTVDGCDAAGAHQHDDTWYCSQTGWQGDYEACTVEGCTELGLHEHDGVSYYCASHGTGRGCGEGRRQ